MADDSVYVDPQQVSNGLAQWDAGSAPLKAGWDQAITRIGGLNTTGTWGTDEAGSTFASQYTDGADAFASGGGELVKQVVDLGTNSREAILNSIASDQVQADQVTVEVDGLP
jgi:hypothetical protein